MLERIGYLHGDVTTRLENESRYVSAQIVSYTEAPVSCVVTAYLCTDISVPTFVFVEVIEVRDNHGYGECYR